MVTLPLSGRAVRRQPLRLPPPGWGRVGVVVGEAPLRPTPALPQKGGGRQMRPPPGRGGVGGGVGEALPPTPALPHKGGGRIILPGGLTPRRSPPRRGLAAPRRARPPRPRPRSAGGT